MAMFAIRPVNPTIIVLNASSIYFGIIPIGGAWLFM